jgi:hypothetical protein
MNHKEIPGSALKGHVRYENTGKTLCGREDKVKETSLYGKLCPECSEIVTKMLRGERKYG